MTSAHTLTLDLGGKWQGAYGSAACPICQPERRSDQNALAIREGGNGCLLLHCHKLGCNFADIVAAAHIGANGYRPANPLEFSRREAEMRATAAKRARQAHRVWQEAQEIDGTLAETYLRSRGITCALPSSLRFHPFCWHGATASRHPALFALIQGGGGFAVHRTYLRADGCGKAALTPVKAMLGGVTGGAVRLTEARGSLVVAEGIETALSLACGLLPVPATIWAALSTSGLRGLRLPTEPGRLTIASDGDVAGRDAAHVLAERAHAIGWAVSLLPAPDGCDWNDILTTTRGNE